MSSLALTGIGQLVTNDPDTGDGPLGLLVDAAVVLDGDRVAWVGAGAAAPAADRGHDLGGAAVLPGFVDSHAHLLFAGDRWREFEARMAGEAYTAGGIAATVAATRAADDVTLLRRARDLAGELLDGGVTTFETKSGYGLTVVDEQRALSLGRQLTAETTFLGAHVVPPEFAGRREEYVELVAGPMLQACAPHARWVDVFCDRGAFDADEAAHILQAGARAGLAARVHGNQLAHGPGVQVAVRAGAASVDHCTYLDGADVAALASSATVATLLPGAEFSTKAPYPDARVLMEAGVTVALATDCNPGSSFTTSMAFCIAVAVREMGMTPAQAVRAATWGGARALRRPDVGQLVPGARADLVVLDAPSYVHLSYRPGVPLVHAVYRGGRLVGPRGRLRADAPATS